MIENPENHRGNTTAVGDDRARQDHISQFNINMSQIKQLDLDVDRYLDLNSQCNIVSEQIKKLHEDVKALRNKNHKLHSQIERIKGNKKILQEISEFYEIDGGVLNQVEMRSIERDIRSALKLYI